MNARAKIKKFALETELHAVIIAASRDLESLDGSGSPDLTRTLEATQRAAIAAIHYALALGRE